MDKPNVIFILVDDLGWAEPACYGHEFNETPNIDELAENGIRFTQAYASSTVCSPSRAGLLTGQAPPRNGITDYLRPMSEWFLPQSYDNADFGDNELPSNTEYRLNKKFTTLGEMFKRCGYSTGIIGKWHLSGYDRNGVKHGPENYGFDEAIISEQTGIGNGSYFHPYTHVDRAIEPVLGEDEYLVDRMNYEAVQFIKKHQKEPFFLYLSHYAVHTVLDAKEDMIAHFSKKRKQMESKKGNNQKRDRKSGGLLKTVVALLDALKWKNLKNWGKKDEKWLIKNNPVLASMLKSIDDGVGDIVRTLKEEGIYENTMIVFTSDNGGDPWVTNNAHLRGGKSFTYEGGLRVPLIISYPKLTPAGIVRHIPTTNLDFYPTFAELIGHSIPKKHTLDGVSILPFMIDEECEEPNRTLSWHYPLKRPHFLGGRSSAANRKNNYKYIRFFDDGSDELYDLANDESEKSNLAGKAEKLLFDHKKMLRNWLRDVGGKVPNRQHPIEE